MFTYWVSDGLYCDNVLIEHSYGKKHELVCCRSELSQEEPCRGTEALVSYEGTCSTSLCDRAIVAKTVFHYVKTTVV